MGEKRQGLTKRDFSFPLQTAMYTRLSTASLVGLGAQAKAVPVHDLMGVPTSLAFPYVTIGDETTESMALDSKTNSGEQITVQVHIWGQYQGAKEVAYIAGQVLTSLTGKGMDLSADGFKLLWFRYEFGNTIKEVDGITVHRVLRFRACMEDTRTAQPTN